MPLITPPPLVDEQVIEPVVNLNVEESRRIELYLNVPPWICPLCGAKMFGRMTYCVYCKIRHCRHTPRPADYRRIK